ncbi:MAG TPA: nitroreductase family protein [Ignavibacteriaceae bacterium]|nr:nitroreductase family protein [Ignavibacteriaceae bacterium]
MSIKTSRTSEKARVKIDFSQCSDCGLCSVVCKDLTLTMKNGKIQIDVNPVFGCVGCAQCVAVCPEDCIEIDGRTIVMDDFVPLTEFKTAADYKGLYSLMFKRRSTRDFKNKEIEQEIIDKIMLAASTSPMGIPPSDVEVVIFNGKEKVKAFSTDFLNYLESIKWMFSRWSMPFWKPFISKEDYEMFKSFLIPLINFLVERNKKGEDWLLYNAPLAMYFYGSPYADPADPYIPATYAMLAAETLGLGTCMIGSIHPFLKGKRAEVLKKKYKINPKNKQGIFVIMGYPKVKYHKGIKRTFAKVVNI